MAIVDTKRNLSLSDDFFFFVLFLKDKCSVLSSFFFFAQLDFPSFPSIYFVRDAFPA